MYLLIGFTYPRNVYCRRHGPGYLLNERYWEPTHDMFTNYTYTQLET